MHNIHRLIYRSPDIAWDTTTSHLLAIIHLSFAPQPIRVQAAKVLDDILLVVPKNLTTAGELQSQVQRRVLNVLAAQVIPDPTAPVSSHTTTSVELRKLGLETLHQILQASGHTLVVGWETIFKILESVCRPLSPAAGALSRSTAADEVVGPLQPQKLLGQNAPSEKSYAALVKIAFLSLTLVCDSVSTLSPEHLRMCISTLGQFGKQADTNIALTAAASLLWSVSDAIQAKRRNAEDEPEYSSLWMFLLAELLGLCTDERAEVRDGAIQTLFRTVQLYGSTLSLEIWEECIWKVVFPLLDELTTAIRNISTSVPSSPLAINTLNPTSPIGMLSPILEGMPTRGDFHAWDESKILALQSLSSIFGDFLVTKLVHMASFEKTWDVFVNQITDAVLLDDRVISAPALKCLGRAVKAATGAVPEEATEKPEELDDAAEKEKEELKSRIEVLWQRAWGAIVALGSAVTRRASGTPGTPTFSGQLHQPFTQESLVAFIEVIQSTRTISRKLTGTEWSLERLSKLMGILKGVLTYPNSPDYRPDVDVLPPVQAIVMDAIASIDLSLQGSSSLVMRDLSEFATLPFLAAFDVPPPLGSSTPSKRVTYIALAKKAMPLLVDLFLKFKDCEEIYVDGTLESVISAYSIPVKLKYDCPAPSKYNKGDLPLWKMATNNFLRVVKECTGQVKRFGDGEWSFI